MKLEVGPVGQHALLSQCNGADDDVGVEYSAHDGRGVEGAAAVEVVHEEGAEQRTSQPVPHLTDLHDVDKRGAVLGVASHNMGIMRRLREQLPHGR